MSVIIEASAAHTASMIFLHGLGDTGHGWAPVMRQLAQKFKFMRFILPHAPVQPVTLNNGFRMPSWYDISSLSEGDESEDVEGLKNSSRVLLSLVSEERQAGIPSERIFIGGFSQGGAVSLFALLTEAETTTGLAGVISLSAYVPGRAHLKAYLQRMKGPAVPIFMAHGTADPVVSYKWHQKSVEYLKTHLADAPSALKVHKYEGMEHCTCGEELADMVEFINERLARGKKDNDDDECRKARKLSEL